MKDEVEKRERGYKDKNSLVRPWGAEELHGADWRKRKLQLWHRCGGQCEEEIRPGVRCRNDMRDAHHVIPRSKGRDDRLANLKGLCREHHNLLDKRKTRFGEAGIK